MNHGNPAVLLALGAVIGVLLVISWTLRDILEVLRA